MTIINDCTIVIRIDSGTRNVLMREARASGLGLSELCRRAIKSYVRTDIICADVRPSESAAGYLSNAAIRK